MPKIKTSKGAKKRFSMTATGKIKRRKAGMRHLLSGKSPAQKRRLGKSALVEKTNRDAIKKLLPYG